MFLRLRLLRAWLEFLLQREDAEEDRHIYKHELVNYTYPALHT